MPGNFPQRPPRCAPESPGTTLQGGWWFRFTEKAAEAQRGARKRRAGFLLSSAGKGGRGYAALVLLHEGTGLCTSHHNPAVQGAETGSLRCEELIPRGNCPEAAGGDFHSHPPTPHPGRGTVTTRPKQAVLGRGIGSGSATDPIILPRH